MWSGVFFLVLVYWILVLIDKKNFISFCFFFLMVVCNGEFLCLLLVFRVVFVFNSNWVYFIFWIMCKGLIFLLIFVLFCSKIFIYFVCFFFVVWWRVVRLLLFFLLMLILLLIMLISLVLFFLLVKWWRMGEMEKKLVFIICFKNWFSCVNGL